MRFPDALRVLDEALADTGAKTTLWLDSFDSLPVIHIRGMAGPPTMTAWERVDGAIIDIYARDRDEAQELADKAYSILNNKPVYTSHGVIDRVTPESSPGAIPYPDGSLIQITFTVRATARPFTQSGDN